jgi:hypothetical protein
MSNINKKPQQKDRAIDALNNVRWKLVKIIAEIDREVDYLERCKKKNSTSARK